MPSEGIPRPVRRSYPERMDSRGSDFRGEVREFLMSRRARVEPEQVGLPRVGTRRVPGLRRGEVAALAGVSVEYYGRLERGAIAGASDAVLDGLVRALRLDDAERDYLYRLARTSGRRISARRGGTASSWRPTPALTRFLDSVGPAAALVGNGRTDLLAWNMVGGALMDEMITSATTTPPNFARFIFTEPVARRFFPDWDEMAAINVAQLRTEAGRDPHNKDLHDLVGELSTRNDHFRTLWGQHDVWRHESGVKRFHHSHVGDLELSYLGLDLVGHEAIQVSVFTAEPGTASADALSLLGLWASTRDHAASAPNDPLIHPSPSHHPPFTSHHPAARSQPCAES